MNEKPQYLFSDAIYVVGSILLVLGISWYIADIYTPDSKHEYTKLAEALITAVPLIYLTYFIAFDSAKNSADRKSVV